MPTLTTAQQQWIDQETRRLNVHGWRLYPWEKKGRKSGHLRLCGTFGDGREVLITRLPAPTAEAGNALYLELNKFLARRDDWQGIKHSDGDAAGDVLTDDGIDWSKL